MRWILLTSLVFPIAVFMFYLYKDLIKTASRTNVKVQRVHNRVYNQQPNTDRDRKRHLNIAK